METLNFKAFQAARVQLLQLRENKSIEAAKEFVQRYLGDAINNEDILLEGSYKLVVPADIRWAQVVDYLKELGFNPVQHYSQRYITLGFKG